MVELFFINWKFGVGVCVVLVFGGYFGVYEKGKVIFGIEKVGAVGVIIFYVGIKF